jgi:hypothetical protein
MLITSLAEVDEVWVLMADHVGQYYDDCVLGYNAVYPKDPAAFIFSL